MAVVTPEKPDAVGDVKTNAAAAMSVPQLKAEVIALADIVEKLQQQIANLQRRRR